MNNFLISGMGRSGTAFLSVMMNKSKKWTVAHEPQPSKNARAALGAVQRRFDNNRHYGEVNSYLRYVFDDLKTDKKGMIIRDPAKIFLSIANRKRNILEGLDELLVSLQESFTIINNAARSGTYVISFEKMVSDVDYTNKIIVDFGIDDVKLRPVHLRKRINQNKSIKYKRFRDLPIPAIRKFRRVLRWFSAAHGYDVP
jgi:hypothetical protein